MTKCQHQHITSGPERAFVGSVASEPYTEENPAAHGSITYTGTCQDCGAERSVNQNGGHCEYGTWSVPLSDSEMHAALAAHKRAHDIAAARKAGIRLREVRGTEARVSTDGQSASQWSSIADIAIAANQEDVALASIYRGLLCMIEDAR